MPKTFHEIMDIVELRKDLMSTEELIEWVYSREVTPSILHEMDNDPFILLLLPFYIVGLVSTIPGHVAEGGAGIINKVIGKK